MSQVKILVIDDDEGMTELLALLLTPASLEIITASSGQEGIELARQHNPGAIILDLMMPEIHGWTVCERIREFSDTPILILSAMDSPGAVAKALDVGADDYLVKPVSSSTLLAHLNKLLRRSRLSLPSAPSASSANS